MNIKAAADSIIMTKGGPIPPALHFSCGQYLLLDLPSLDEPSICDYSSATYMGIVHRGLTARQRHEYPAGKHRRAQTVFRSSKAPLSDILANHVVTICYIYR